MVCDRLTTRIHTQFNGHPWEVHTVLLTELDQPEKQALLRRLWTDPESFRPKKTSRDITEAAAKSFASWALITPTRPPGGALMLQRAMRLFKRRSICSMAGWQI